MSDKTQHCFRNLTICIAAHLICCVTVYICFSDRLNVVLAPFHGGCFVKDGNSVNDTFNINMNLRVSHGNHSTCNAYVKIDSKMGGRLGNKMFFLAVVIGTAYKLNITPVLEKSSPLRNLFDLPALPDVKLSNIKTFKTADSHMYLPALEHLDTRYNWSLNGYYQSWKYFDSVSQIIRKTFKVKERYMGPVRRFLLNVTKPGYQNVCLHVRRGDMLEKRYQKYLAVGDMTFINKAMEFYRDKFKAVQIIVLSNGMSWCKNNIHGEHVIFSPFIEAISDMALMMSCDHVIVTAGSFGWWGAWLSGGTTVYFSGFKKNDSIRLHFRTEDYYPPNWIAL